jgi:hypothetical protein
MVCLGNICINTLNKGAKDDDNDDDNNNNRKNLEAVPGKLSIDSLQKRAILGTPHIIRKVLQCEA